MHRKRQASHGKTRPFFATPNRRHLTSARSRVDRNNSFKATSGRKAAARAPPRQQGTEFNNLPQPANRGASRRRGTERSLGGRSFDAQGPPSNGGAPFETGTPRRRTPPATIRRVRVVDRRPGGAQKSQSVTDCTTSDGVDGTPTGELPPALGGGAARRPGTALRPLARRSPMEIH